MDTSMVDMDALIEDDSASQWEREAARAAARDRRTRRWAVLATVLAALTLVARLALHFTGSGEVIFVFASAAGLLWASRSTARGAHDRELRRSFELWTRARTADEALDAAVRALSASLGQDDEQPSLTDLYSRLAAAASRAGVNVSVAQLERLTRAAHARIAEVAQLRATRVLVDRQVAALRGEAIVLQSAIAAAKARLKQAELAAAQARGAARAAHVERAEAHAAEVLQYPQGSLVPTSTVGVSTKALRDEVASAQERAERGVVVESPIAAAVISDAARWSPYGAPLHLTRELLELFEPSAAPVVRGAVGSTAEPTSSDATSAPVPNAAAASPLPPRDAAHKS